MRGEREIQSRAHMIDVSQHPSPARPKSENFKRETHISIHFSRHIVVTAPFHYFFTPEAKCLSLLLTLSDLGYAGEE